MGHAGIVRLWHLVKRRNLAFELADIENVCESCLVCDKIKPKYFKASPSQLIWATQPLQKLYLSIEVPIANSDNRNKYLFTATDEYSQFVWGFSLPDRSDDSVTRSLAKFFTFIGAPKFIHERADSGIITSTVKNFLRDYGVSTNKITPTVEAITYADEHFFGVLWQTIKLFMEDSGDSNKNWQIYLRMALQAQRTLLNTKTNKMPPDRMFFFDRKFHGSVGGHVPKWLCDSKKVVFNDVGIDPPMAQEVQLVHSNTDSAHIKLPNGKDLRADTEHLFPVLNGAKENLQNQDLVDLTSDTDSVYDAFDSDSDVYCLDENVPSHTAVKLDPYCLGSPSHQQSVASEEQNSIDGQNSPSSGVPSPISGRIDGPPVTRLRTRLEDMVLRSGRALPRR